MRHGLTAAHLLLALVPASAGLYLLAIAQRALPTRPGVVWVFAALLLAALALAARARARGAIATAILELALLVPLHGLLTFVRAWRLEGG